MAALATPGRDVKPARSRIEGYRNFATKLWNAARFCEMNECRPVAGFDPARATDTLNRWIGTEATRTARAVTAALEAYRFDEAASVLYRFVWNTFCDWYLELAKPVLSGADGTAKDETRATVAWALQNILGMLHPFMPFVTEELWQRTQADRGMLAVSRWPALQFEDEAAAAEINWLVSLISEIRSVRSEMNVPAGAQVPVAVSGANDVTKARLKAHDTVIRRLARAESVEILPHVLAGAVQLVVGEMTVSLSIAGIVDLTAERQRLAKELERVGREIAKVDAKLGNQQFMAKAPEEIVEEQRERRAEADALRLKLRAALDRLSL
jgi:valyl-tRNA synthetase